MARRKGTPLHRVLGWSFVAPMALAALSSAFIRDSHLPGIAGFTPIHALTVLTRSACRARSGRSAAATSSATGAR